MQGMLASLVFSMSVKDDTFRAAMATNRSEVRKTEQDFDKSGRGMVAAMQDTARGINDAAIRVVDRIGRMGAEVKRNGMIMTVGLTLPLGLLAKTAKDTAADFETSMNGVNAAMIGVKPDQLDKLRDAALRLGPAYGKSAIEAANAIADLARNGMSAADILGGGLSAALKLSVVGQTETGKAADLTTDIMAQFNMTASQTPAIVDKISGALDASKLGMDDYALAAGNAGGVVGALGYSFDDFNTGLAATAPLFDSGASAGTSYRAFLTSLAGKSEDAQKAMKQLGLEFYNADGSAKSLAQIADQLQKKMGGLSDQSKTVFLNKMFGDDGAQTAVKLIQIGMDGILKAQKEIGQVTADQKIAILLDGEAAAAQRVSSAWEKLKIVVGEAGIIQFFTLVNEAVAGTLTALGSAPPWFYKLVVVAGLAAASLGPLTIAAVTLAKFALPLLALRLGPVALGMAAIINPAGVLIRLLGELAMKAGGAALIGRFGAAMVGAAGGIGLLVTALSIIIPLYMQGAKASDAVTTALENSKSAHQASVDLTLQLATATGEAKNQLLAKAKADRVAAIAAIQSAKATLAAARAESERARMQEKKPSMAQRAYNVLSAGSSPWEKSIDRKVGSYLGLDIAPDRMGAALDYQAAAQAQQANIDRFNVVDKAIRDAEGPSKSKNNLAFDDGKGDKKTRTPKGRNTSADDEDFAAKLAEVRNAQLQANADLTGSYEARYRADMDSLDADRATYAKQLATDERLTEAKRGALLAEKDKELVTRKAVIEQTRSNAKAQEGFDLFQAANDAQQDVVKSQIDMADSAAARMSGERRLLDLQRQQEEKSLDLILATAQSSSVEWQKAANRKEELDAIYARKGEQITRQNEGPADAYLRTLNRSTSAINEDVQSGAVDALKGLNTGLTDALMGTAKLGDAFENMGKRIIASLIDIAIQQAIIKPIANSLFGAADASGNRSGGSFSAITGLLSRTFGGGKATGGAIDPSNWYVVGEKGPELFAPGVSGTVIPNGGRGSRPSGGGIASIVPSPYFDAVVDGRVVRGSMPVAQATMASGMAEAGRASSWRARQTLG